MKECSIVYELVKDNYDGRQFARLFFNFADAVREAENDMRYEFVDKCARWHPEDWECLKINPFESEKHVVRMSEELCKAMCAYGLYKDFYRIVKRTVC